MADGSSADDRRLTTDDWLSADGLFQIRHFYRRQRGLEAFVSHFQPGAVNGLLQRVAGEHTEGVRDAGFLRRLADPARDFICDHIVVCRVAPQQASEADDRE